MTKYAELVTNYNALVTRFESYQKEVKEMLAKQKEGGKPRPARPGGDGPAGFAGTAIRTFRHLEVHEAADDVVNRLVGHVLRGGRHKSWLIVGHVVAAHREGGVPPFLAPFRLEQVGQLHPNIVVGIDVPGFTGGGEAVVGAPALGKLSPRSRTREQTWR